MSKKTNWIRKGIQAADGLSLGISMVVAVLIGIGLGYLMKKFTPFPWLFWVGVFWGIAAAILNVYKAYQTQIKNYEEFTQRDAMIQEKIKQNKE